MIAYLMSVSKKFITAGKKSEPELLINNIFLKRVNLYDTNAYNHRTKLNNTIN